MKIQNSEAFDEFVYYLEDYNDKRTGDEWTNLLENLEYQKLKERLIDRLNNYNFFK